jgi:hypothetical protein
LYCKFHLFLLCIFLDFLQLFLSSEFIGCFCAFSSCLSIFGWSSLTCFSCPL